MNKIRLIIFHLLFIIVAILLFINGLYPENNTIQPTVFPESSSSEFSDYNAKPDQNNKSKNINLDMQALYGIQYKQLFSGFSLSQERNTFVYLLTSKFNRSGDFGYNDETYVNSGYYENNLGLTVNWNWTDTKLIIEGEADNESRGMFNNDVYSREEKSNNKISAKTIYKLSPSAEVFFSMGGAWYNHSLIAIDPSDLVRSRLIQGNFKAGGEYVWSASNRMRLNTDFLYYDYIPKEVESDRHFKAEIIDDFNVSRNIGVSIGVGYINNKDDKSIKIPVPYSISLSLKEYKYLACIFLYKFDIVPFRAEEFYLKQKYINPTYNLPPGSVHTGEIKTESRLNSILELKGNFKIEKNNNFYNYVPVNGNVLSADTLEVVSYNPGVEANISVLKKIWEIALTYNYFYFDAEKNITYIPDHEAAGIIRFNSKNWKIEWTNKLRGKVRSNPDTNEKIPEAFIGSLGIQRKMLEGSYFYGKFENLYNSRYTIRKSYPEPGISFLMGLRILI